MAKSPDGPETVGGVPCFHCKADAIFPRAGKREKRLNHGKTRVKLGVLALIVILCYDRFAHLLP